MAQVELCVLDVADGRQAGQRDGANASVNYVVVPQDLQNMRLVIDIGDNRSIEIPLRGNLILQNRSGTSPGAVAAGVDGDAAAAQGQSEQDAEDRESPENMRVLDVADGRQAGEADGANGSVNYVAVPQDLQDMRLVVDIGDNRSIEIPLRGNLILQNSSGTPPVAAAAAGVDGDADAEDMEDLEKMRGWLMTMALLFIGLAFQAALHPPDWMPKDWMHKDWSEMLFGMKIAALSPNPIEDARATTPTIHDRRACGYVAVNTITFAIALAVVIKLMVMKKSQASRTIRIVKRLVALVAGIVASTLIESTSDDPRVTTFGVVIFEVYFILCFCWDPQSEPFRRRVISIRRRFVMTSTNLCIRWGQQLGLFN